MKRFLRVLLKVILGIVSALVLAVLVLAGAWLFRREDPTAFLPASYVAYLQVPSLRTVYDQWLNLEAADVVLARPDLAVYRSVVADVRGLALTRSPFLRTLLDVHADVMLLPGGKLVAVLDLGWRGILSPLARIVAPQLGVKGFSFLNDAGMPMYRYTTGGTTIHAAIVNSVAVVSLDPDTVKSSLALWKSDTGLAAKASRDLLRRIRLRAHDSLRILVDTQSLSTDLLSASPLGAKVLDAVEIPGQSMLDVKLSNEKMDLNAGMPVSVSLPALSKALAVTPSPIGVLRYVPSRATLLSISNIAPLADLYAIAAVFQGKDVQDIYAKADSGAKSVVGMGIDKLLFSWVGAEAGAFMLPGTQEPVFFVRISDEHAYETSLAALTTSAVAGKDNSLVLDGVRIDKLSIPWYVDLILQTLGVNAPEPFFIARGGYFFLSLEAQNLAAVAKTADTGDNIATAGPWAALAKGMPANASLLLWYDVTQAEPFFLRGESLLGDILRLYARGAVTLSISTNEVDVSLSAERALGAGARAVPGYPVSPAGGAVGDVLAFRWSGGGAPLLAWVRGHDTVILADAQGVQGAEVKLEPDLSLLLEKDTAGGARALWAVSSAGTVWRFGPRLEVRPPFPVQTGIASPMPPAVLDGKLTLYSRSDATLVFVAQDGARTSASQHLDAQLLQPPDLLDGLLAFYPKSFDARVHLTDETGREATGWPVSAAGISWCAPRLLAAADGIDVTFLTQAGSLHVWKQSGDPVPPFPIQLPGVFYATPEPITVDGSPALVVMAQDGTVSLVGLDGSVLRQATLGDIDGRAARIEVTDLGKGGQAILIYGSGAFVAGLDSSLRPLPGFPLKGITRPQIIDLNRDGALDLVTAGLDGKIYAYTVGGAGS
jgi:hypothetical protein